MSYPVAAVSDFPYTEKWKMVGTVRGCGKMVPCLTVMPACALALLRYVLQTFVSGPAPAMSATAFH